ncbi:MAG: hypothetical protein HQ562_09220 [Candidatus Marinimicrobia bacterium]|nr:hypothetical protein [Candidatus Neomarinimicrobiota bacterium]
MQSVNLIKRIVQTCLTLSTLSFGNDFEKRTYSIVKVTTTPVINGIIDDAFWGMAEVADYFTQYLPKSESLRSQSSDARLLFDDHDIYVAVRMYNDPVQISAQLLRCDARGYSDQFGIGIESYNDKRSAFSFYIISWGPNRIVWF